MGRQKMLVWLVLLVLGSALGLAAAARWVARRRRPGSFRHAQRNANSEAVQTEKAGGGLTKQQAGGHRDSQPSGQRDIVVFGLCLAAPTAWLAQTALLDLVQHLLGGAAVVPPPAVLQVWRQRSGRWAVRFRVSEVLAWALLANKWQLAGSRVSIYRWQPPEQHARAVATRRQRRAAAWQQAQQQQHQPQQQQQHQQHQPQQPQQHQQHQQQQQQPQQQPTQEPVEAAQAFLAALAVEQQGTDGADPADGADLRCTICGQLDEDPPMLICDGCQGGWHITCLNPPLPGVPDGDWYCLQCSPAVVHRQQRAAARAQHLARAPGSTQQRGEARAQPEERQVRRSTRLAVAAQLRRD